MPSRKQEIYCQLLKWGILHLRMVCAGGTWSTDEKLLGMRKEFELGWQQANFLHKVHLSILDPAYNENDITFVNAAFPCHIGRMGDALGAELAALMLEFYESMPDDLRTQVTWHPSAELKRLASQFKAS